MTIDELLDQAKKKANIESDYALAKILGVTSGNLSNIRTGKAHPSNEVAVKLATLGKMEEMMVIAEIEYRTANKPEKKKFWKHYIESRGITAVIAMCAIGLTIAITPEPSKANVLQIRNYDGNLHVQNAKGIYIMRISRVRQVGIVRGMVSRLT
jgi:plasmid maintenance system antidote protein VapI